MKLPDLSGAVSSNGFCCERRAASPTPSTGIPRRSSCTSSGRAEHSEPPPSPLCPYSVPSPPPFHHHSIPLLSPFQPHSISSPSPLHPDFIPSPSPLYPHSNLIPFSLHPFSIHSLSPFHPLSIPSPSPLYPHWDCSITMPCPVHAAVLRRTWGSAGEPRPRHEKAALVFPPCVIAAQYQLKTFHLKMQMKAGVPAQTEGGSGGEGSALLISLSHSVGNLN